MEEGLRVGVKKIQKFCGHHKWKLPMESQFAYRLHMAPSPYEVYQLQSGVL